MNNAATKTHGHLGEPEFFHRLHWKLTRDFTLATAGVIVMLQGLAYAGVMGLLFSFFLSPRFPQELAETLNEAAPQLRPHMAVAEQAPTALAQLMRQFTFDADLDWKYGGLQFLFHHHFQGTADTRTFLDERVRFVGVTDLDGRVRARAGQLPASIGAALPAHLPEGGAELLARARDGANAPPRQLAARTAQNEVIAVAPIREEATGRPIGLLWAYVDAGWDWDLVYGLAGEILPQLAMVPVIGLLLSLGAGYFAARKLTRRLNALARVAEQWGEGALQAQAPEMPRDELGALGARLNRMARDLRGQIALQQRLATLEERNRLARDLHDTIKQQLFACLMQISTARRTLTASPAHACERLDEAEALARQMQQELSDVLHELAPPDQPHRFVSQTLQELTAVWSRRTGIPVEWQSLASPRLSPTAQLALTRIAQEALTNSARHSGASRVTIALAEEPEGRLRLRIEDDGRGFDPEGVSHGIGLKSMRARAESLPGGAFALATAPGRGVRIEIDVQPEPANDPCE